LRPHHALLSPPLLALLVYLTGAPFVLVFPSAVAQDASPTPSGQLQQVVVTGENPTTEESAIERERYAPNLERVQSAEGIAHYPDVNLADALKRLPGVGVQNDTGEGRYITVRGLDSNLVGVTFGGVRVPSTDANGRHVAFDQIPSGLVSQIIVYDTNRPDMDAEALGGQIELTPRSAFDSNKPFLEGHVGTGYEPLRPRYPIISGEIIGGFRFGLGSGGNPLASSYSAPESSAVNSDGTSKDDKGIDTQNAGSGEGLAGYRPFGVLGEFSYYEDHRGVDDFEPAFADAKAPIGADKILSSIDLRRYIYNRRLHGVGATFDYRPDSKNSFYISFVNGGYVESVDRQIKNYSGLDGSNGSGTMQTNPDGSTFFVPRNDPTHPGNFLVTDASLNSNIRHNEEHFDNWIVQGGGKNDLGLFIIDYKGSFAQATDQNPRDTNISFVTNPDVTISYNDAGLMKQPQFLVAGADVNDPRKYSFNRLSFDNNGSTDTEIAGSVNITIPITIFSFPSAFKFGTNLRFRTKTHYDDPETYVAYNGTFTLADVTRSSFNNIYNGAYKIGFSPDFGLVTKFFSANRGNFVRDSVGDAVTSKKAFFDDSEDVYAGYFQYNISFGRLNLLSGLRIEATDATYGANVNDPGSNPNDPASYHFVNRNKSYVNYFPTFQARYEILDNLQARFSYSTAIGRPAFSQVTAATTVSPGNLTITTGNPGLKPTTANNFDLALEYYPAPGAFATVGFFDKEFSDYIFTRTIRVPINGSTFNESTFLNSPNAYARGVELSYQQQFFFLPGPLGGFGAGFNYTYVDSQGEARPGQTTHLPFTSTNLYNWVIFYRRYGFDVTLAAQHTGKNLSSVGANFRTDQYFDARTTLDLAASYTFPNGVGMYFNVKNLTDAPWRIYEGTRNRVIQQEYYDFTYEFGMKFKF
jgi:TonB-dependent receptor